MGLAKLDRKARSLFGHYVAHAYVISFVKAGRTWLRMLLIRYYSHALRLPRSDDWLALWLRNRAVPLIRLTHASSDKDELEEFSFNFRRLASRKVIYLYRDPRDILISYYFQLTHRHHRLDANTPIHDYIRDERFGLPRIVGFMNLMVDQLPLYPQLHCLTYEELHTDTAAATRSVLTFLGVQHINEPALEAAIADCQFERMQEMERRGEFKHYSLRFHNPADPSTYKVREGKVGGYRAYLNAEDLDFVECYLSQHLHPMYAHYIHVHAAPLPDAVFSVAEEGN